MILCLGIWLQLTVEVAGTSRCQGTCISHNVLPVHDIIDLCIYNNKSFKFNVCVGVRHCNCIIYNILLMCDLWMTYFEVEEI